MAQDMRALKLEITMRLYRSMPGARMPPIIDGYYAWGEIDGTDEWAFCAALAEELATLRVAVAKLQPDE